MQHGLRRGRCAQTGPRGAGARPDWYGPNIPAKIKTPDSVYTRAGTLHFGDGAPDRKTVRLVYEQIDLARGNADFLI